MRADFARITANRAALRANPAREVIMLLRITREKHARLNSRSLAFRILTRAISGAARAISQKYFAPNRKQKLSAKFTHQSPANPDGISVSEALKNSERCL